MHWRQGQAHSQDLRDRVMAAVDEGKAVETVAEFFKVDRSYIYKALARRRDTGEVTARAQRCHLPRKLAPYHEALRAHVAAHKDATLAELCAWLLATHGIRSSQGGMWNTLARLGLTLKKDKPRGRADAARCRRGKVGLARGPSEAERRTPCLHRRDLGDDQHGPPACPRAARRARRRVHPARTLAHDDVR